MAAIAGILRLDGQSMAANELRGVMARLAHRAPDGIGLFDEGVLALAHGALWTTPESAFERQPVTLGDRWVVVVDGRIDNRDQLARALDIAPSDLARTGDAGLLALAWRHWGARFVDHVVGDFALAAWDRGERRLFLLRDPIGVRPLFFASTQRLLAFASEPEALFDLDGVSRVCDQDGLAYLLADDFEFDDQERTLYRDVRRLRPGWLLEIDASGQMRRASCWQPSQSPASSWGRDASDFVAEFVGIYDEAVRCRLRSSPAPALLLSGGIDSGCVLAAARRLGREDAVLPVWPISLIETKVPVSSESENIRRLHADGTGLLIPVEDLQSHPAFPQFLKQTWEAAHPIDNSLSYAGFGCQVAREAGCRVVMDGADGDVVLTSNACRAGALAKSGHLLRALREARLANGVNTYLQGVGALRILLRGLATELQPEWLARWRWRRNARRSDKERLEDAWIDPSFAKRLQLRERQLAMALVARRHRAGVSRQEHLAWTWWNPGFQRAMEGTDRTYAQFGIEAWHPWCDRRVVEFFYHLPEEFLARDGWTKWIARTAYAPELGRAIAFYSGKSHLGEQLGEAVLASSHVEISGLLAVAQERLAGVVNTDAVTRLRREWDADPSASIRNDGDSLWLLTTVVAWMERYRLQCV